MNILQFGIDLGHTIAHTDCPNPNDLREKARKIIEALGLTLNVDEDPTFLIGLGVGLADRHREPLGEVALDLMGESGLQNGDDSL
ncbi:MAG TPA: hypothetical protein VHV10_04965 [Ktedonobacteraceae bacterium]|jgi:hypothetical protein|nr:hypothetical protein [Ktedonobacteraceae bacterium]